MSDGPVRRTPRRSSRPRPTGLAGRRRLEARARTVLESITDAFFLLDEEWRFAYVNQRALDYFGKSRDELVGHVIWDVFPQARDSEFHTQYERAVREGSTVEFEARSLQTDRWVEVHAYPSAEGLSVHFRDVTQRRAGQARDRFLVQLDDAIRALTHPNEIVRTAARLLTEHLAVDRCAYADVSDGLDTFEVIGDYSDTVPSVIGRHNVADFGEDFVRSTLAGEPFVVEDVEHDPRTSARHETYRRLQIGALISVPLKKDSVFVGGLAAHHRTPRRWHPDEVELVHLVANRCWESIERARLTRGLLRKTRFLTVLAENGVELLSEERPHTLIGSLFQRASDLLDLEVCLHFLVTRDGTRLRLAASRGIDEKTRADLKHVAFGESVCGIVAVRKAPVVCAAVQERTDAMTEWIRAFGLCAYACFPLIAGGQLIGVVSFGTRSRDALSADDLEFLGATSDQVAAAYARARASDALRDSEDRLRQAVAIAELGTFDTDLRTDAVLMNAPGRAIYGFTEDEPLTFAGVQAHFHPDDRHRVMGAVKSALDPSGQGTFDVEHRILRTDGSERWVRIRGQAVFEITTGVREAHRCIGTYVDVTERKQAEERRERVLTRERAARAEAERVGLLKDEFLATLSHELRTPMNAILGWSQVLRQGRVRPGSLESALAAIDRNAHAQAQLIDDLLDMSRIVSGTMRIDVHAVDLTPIVQAAIESISPAADTKHIAIHESLERDGVLVRGDAARLQQVVWNLLSNAVKFTSTGGRVTVALKRIEPFVDLTVSDTGIGIAPDFLPHVFERFRQQDASVTRHHGGLGLGLSIVKQLVELHGGTVRAESNGEGFGASFSVVLPSISAATARDLGGERASRRLRPRSGSMPPKPLPLADLRVMVVDDEPDARDLLVAVLQDAGATVFMVDSAQGALRQLSHESIDVLVSDIGMPDVDGYELIRRIRRLPDDTSQVPAVAVTAYARVEDRERVLRAGFQGHVAKPLHVDELIGAVARVARRPRM